METSGFTETQLQVREAVAKICSNFPDVCVLAVNKHAFLTQNRNTGQHMMNPENTLMNFTLLSQSMAGLALLSQRISEGLGSASQKQP